MVVLLRGGLPTHFVQCRPRPLFKSTKQSLRRGVRFVRSSSAKTPEITDVLETLLRKENLTEAQATQALEAVLNGAAIEQLAAFLVLLRAKGETAAEVSGLAKALQRQAVHVKTPCPVLDIVGTGGDGIGSVNVSTGATIVAAAAGAKVAKHGSRSVSSLCGSADVLEALGVDVELGPESVSRCISEVGVGFMFAPRYHPAFLKISPVRKALKLRTAFNMMGPMLNPASATFGLVGVWSTSIAPLMAESLQQLGMQRALVVHSCGLDELTPMGPADVVDVRPGSIKALRLDPAELGIPRCEVEDLKGGTRELNAQILQDVFGGAKGAVADALCLNAGVALAIAGQASDWKEGVAMAQEAQQSGKTGDVLRHWIQVSNECRQKEAATAT